MEVGERLTELRLRNKMSQGDIEQKSGLLRCYISRVENGHTVPSVETLQKMAGALGIPLYRIFYDGEVPKKVVNQEQPHDEKPDSSDMKKLRKFLAKMSDRDQKILLRTLTAMVGRKRKHYENRNGRG